MQDILQAYERFKHHFDKHSNIYVYSEYTKDLKLILSHKPKYGYWQEEGEDLFKCSFCGELSCCRGNFCSNCGAEMDNKNND